MSTEGTAITGQLHSLIWGLKHRDYAVRQRAAEALVEIGAPAVPALREAALHARYEVRQSALSGLVRIGEPAVPVLCEVLEHKALDLHWVAADALVRIGPPAVANLCQLLQSPRWQVRSRVAEALGQIGDPSALGPLSAALRDKRREVCLRALEALAATGGEAAATCIAESMVEGWADLSVPREALVKIGPLAVPALRGLLEDTSWEVRGAAVAALGRIGDPQVVPDLAERLQCDPDLGVRWRAAEALGNIRDDGVVPALIEALDDPLPTVRIVVVDALEKLKDPQAVPALNEKLDDPDAEVRSSAIRVLAGLPDSSTIAPLITALKTGSIAPADAAPLLIAIAEADPVLELRAALPLLHRGLRLPVGRIADACGSAISCIERNTAALKDLPLPAAAPTPAAKTLPIPAVSAAPPPDALPIPAAEGHADLVEREVPCGGGWWRGVWRRAADAAKPRGRD